MAGGGASASSSKITFTRVMKKAYMTALPIPEQVYDKYATGALRGTVILDAGGGREWQVEVGSSGSFTAGWKQFCVDNDLKDGDLAVFNHVSGRRFSVLLYGADGSAKEGGAPGKSRGGEEEGGSKAVADAVEKLIKECVVHLDANSSLKFVVTKVPRVPEDKLVSDAPAAKGASQRYGGGGGGGGGGDGDGGAAEPSTPQETKPASGPSTRTRASPRSAPPARSVLERRRKKKALDEEGTEDEGEEEDARPAKRSKTVPLRKLAARPVKREPAKLSRRKSKVVSKLTALEVHIDSAPARSQDDHAAAATKSAAAAKRPIKAVVREKKPVKEKKPVAAAITPKASGDGTSSGRKQIVAVNTPAYQQATALKTSHPSTVIVMKKSNIAPCFYLSVPNEFAKSHLPDGVQEFDMVDSTSKAWGVRWLGPPKRAFSGGWCYFAQDHGLQLNDVCVLEIVSDKMVRVNIFRDDASKQLALAAKDDKDDDDDVHPLGGSRADEIDAVVTGITADDHAAADAADATADVAAADADAADADADAADGNADADADAAPNGGAAMDGDDGDDDEDDDYDPANDEGNE